MPIEVIDLPCVIGSGRNCNVWVNSPRIETRHLKITQGEGVWELEDLGSEHGTFIGDRRVTRRAIGSGDEYRLAGYLRLRTELR
jgi:pSer/pThr/pTyr-binding forkhead associated (FHA) protein